MGNGDTAICMEGGGKHVDLTYSIQFTGYMHILIEELSLKIDSKQFINCKRLYFFLSSFRVFFLMWGI